MTKKVKALLATVLRREYKETAYEYDQDVRDMTPVEIAQYFVDTVGIVCCAEGLQFCCRFDEMGEFDTSYPIELHLAAMAWYKREKSFLIFTMSEKQYSKEQLLSLGSKYNVHPVKIVPGMTGKYNIWMFIID